MKFDELDQKMRVFETATDYCVLPGLSMVARLNGRSFTRLTKEIHSFDAPFEWANYCGGGEWEFSRLNPSPRARRS